MRAGRHLSLILAFAVLPVCHASAQPLPWPTDSPKPGAAPWPAAGAPAAVPGMAPAMSPAPMPGFGAPPAPDGEVSQCVAEFTKLKVEVEKRGKVAKAASERKVTREEMCKLITAYSAVEVKWVKFTEDNEAKCGIPPNVVQQLKIVRTGTEQTREKICAPQVGVTAAPSLSDALGTTRLPTPQTTRTGSGTLDTLTGNAIQNR
jgi:hypothetical protein